jgi:hypothetical protein
MPGSTLRLHLQAAYESHVSRKKTNGHSLSNAQENIYENKDKGQPNSKAADKPTKTKALNKKRSEKELPLAQGG